MNQTKYLLEDELENLLKLLMRPSEYSSRNALMLTLLVSAGPRASEFLSLRVKDFNARERTLFIGGLKGSYDRVIPISGSLSKRLSAYLRDMPPDSLMFPIKYNQLRNIWAEWRPVKKKLHALRHTFAIELLKKSKDIKLVQKALGHRHLSNTFIYSDYQFPIDEMRKYLVD